MLVILYIKAVLFWLNCIPTKFANYSLLCINKNQIISYKTHYKHSFGVFVLVVEKTTNPIKVLSTIDTLTAFPKENKQE